MIFRSEPRIFGQSFLFRKPFCSHSSKTAREQNKKRRRQESIKAEEVRTDPAKRSREKGAAYLSTGSAAAGQRERESRTRRGAAKRAREKFQPTLPSCSSLQMSHVTWGAAVAGGMGGGLFRHPFFTQCCPESFWEHRGRGQRGLG